MSGISIGPARLESYGVRPPAWLLGCVFPKAYNLSWTEKGDWSFDPVVSEIRAKRDTAARVLIEDRRRYSQALATETAALASAIAAREAMRLEIRQHNERVLAKARDDVQREAAREAARRASLWEACFKEIELVWGRRLTKSDKAWLRWQ